MSPICTKREAAVHELQPPENVLVDWPSSNVFSKLRAGGLDKQIQELVEAVVLPVTHKERFKSLGIRPPKGVLLYGPPGTGGLARQARNTW